MNNRKDLTHNDLLMVTRNLMGGNITTRTLVRVTAPRDDSSPMTDLKQPPFVMVQPIDGGPEFDLYDDDVDRSNVQHVDVVLGGLHRVRLDLVRETNHSQQPTDRRVRATP